MEYPHGILPTKTHGQPNWPQSFTSPRLHAKYIPCFSSSQPPFELRTPSQPKHDDNTNNLSQVANEDVVVAFVPFLSLCQGTLMKSNLGQRRLILAYCSKRHTVHQGGEGVAPGARLAQQSGKLFYSQNRKQRGRTRKQTMLQNLRVCHQ